MRRVIIFIGLTLGMLVLITPFHDPMEISCDRPKLVLNIPKNDRPAWEREGENSKYTYGFDDYHIYVTLSSIPEADISAWLYKSHPKVNWAASMAGILDRHLIKDTNSFTLESVKETWSFQDIQDNLVAKGLPLQDSFQHYVALSFNASNKLELEPSTSFETDKFYYSMAFFMAVGRDNNFNSSTEFTFNKGKHKDTDISVIIIEVDGVAGKKSYDFAQYPPLK